VGWRRALTPPVDSTAWDAPKMRGKQTLQEENQPPEMVLSVNRLVKTPLSAYPSHPYYYPSEFRFPCKIATQP